MPYCCAWNCQNKTGEALGTSFHRFPFAKPDILRLWVHNVNRPDWEPNSRSVLCSDHFLERCFDRSGQTVRLRWDAVPTMFAYPDDRVQGNYLAYNIYRKCWKAQFLNQRYPTMM